MARHDRLDAVVDNAGGSPYALAAEASPRFHHKIIELNLLALLHMSQAANADVQRGRAVVRSSRSPVSKWAAAVASGTAAYGAAKAGVDSLTRSLAVEWAPKVRVNAVVAGMVATEQVELFYGDDESQAAVAATVPLGRLADPRRSAGPQRFWPPMPRPPSAGPAPGSQRRRAAPVSVGVGRERNLRVGALWFDRAARNGYDDAWVY